MLGRVRRWWRLWPLAGPLRLREVPTSVQLACSSNEDIDDKLD